MSRFSRGHETVQGLAPCKLRADLDACPLSQKDAAAPRVDCCPPWRSFCHAARKEAQLELSPHGNTQPGRKPLASRRPAKDMHCSNCHQLEVTPTQYMHVNNEQCTSKPERLQDSGNLA
jgi:hypothetical protein